MNYHLKNDLYINKQTLKKSFENQYGWLSSDDLLDRGLDKVKKLLEKRTQVYTKNEIESLLFCAWWTSNDELINDLGGEPLEEYRLEQKREAINYALEVIESNETI